MRHVDCTCKTKMSCTPSVSIIDMSIEIKILALKNQHKICIDEGNILRYNQIKRIVS